MNHGMTTATTMQISVHFYAQLREQAGTESATVSTSVSTVGALYEELKATHGFTLNASSMQAAVNDAFCAWDQPIRDGDAVTFVPPVAGG